MKLRILIIFIAFATIFFSCGKEDNGPTSPENTTPKLSLNTLSLSFSIDNDKTFLLITNIGGGELSWEIVGKPEWIDISKLSGQLTNETDTVMVTANTGLNIGDYSWEININSNGGTAVVNISLSIEAKIEIFPGIGAAKIKLGDTYGIGAAKIKLGDTYSVVEQFYGNPDRHLIFELYDPNTGSYVYWHYLYYDSIKAVFEIFNHSSSFYESDIIISVKVEYPYDGLTDKLIGIGSSLNDVVVAYGEPPEINTGYTNYYKYQSLGIDFYYDEGDTLVTKIEVYYPE